MTHETEDLELSIDFTAPIVGMSNAAVTLKDKSGERITLPMRFKSNRTLDPSEIKENITTALKDYGVDYTVTTIYLPQ